MSRRPRTTRAERTVRTSTDGPAQQVPRVASADRSPAWQGYSSRDDADERPHAARLDERSARRVLGQPCAARPSDGPGQAVTDDPAQTQHVLNGLAHPAPNPCPFARLPAAQGPGNSPSTSHETLAFPAVPQPGAPCEVPLSQVVLNQPPSQHAHREFSGRIQGDPLPRTRRRGRTQMFIRAPPPGGSVDELSHFLSDAIAS